MNGHKLLKESGLLAKYKIDERVIPTRKQRRAVLRYLDLLERQINVGALQKKALGQLSRVYSGYRWFQKLSLNLSFAAVLGLLQGQFANADEVLSSSVNRQLATQTQDYIQAKAAADFTSAAPTQAIVQEKRSVQSLHLLANQSADASYQQSLASLNNEEFFVADNAILTVIDPALDQWEILSDAVQAGEVLLLKVGESPLEQIIAKVKTMGQVKVLNILSHGADGEIYLAGQSISARNLNEYKQQLQELGALLTEDGQLQLFGCDVAKSGLGKDFVTELAQITGADVAGSVNLTGSGIEQTNHPSDWDLEYFTGEQTIGVAQTFNSKRLLAYNNVLATVYTFDDLPGYMCYDYGECSAVVSDLTVRAVSSDPIHAVSLWGDYMVSALPGEEQGVVYAGANNGGLWLMGGGVQNSGVPRSLEVSKTDASDFTPNSVKVRIWTYRSVNSTSSPDATFFEIVGLNSSNVQVASIKYESVYDDDTIDINFSNPASSVYTRNNGGYFTGAPILTQSGSFATVRKLQFKTGPYQFGIDDLSIGALVVNNPPVNSVAPAITGTATVGNALFGSDGSWTDVENDPLTYSRQWYRADDASGTNRAAIASATGAIYTLITSDAHKYIQLVVTANDGNGGTTPANSVYTPILNSAPVNSALPSIIGTAVVGSTLSTSNGTWSDADGDGRTFTYQWYRADDSSGTNLVVIAGANSSSYTLTANDAQKYLRVVVTANDGYGGTTPANSAYTSAVNTLPSNIALSSSSVNQSAGVNAIIGTLSSTDPDIGNTFTYTLVAGVGDTHNTSFNISGSSLRANDSSALTAGNHSVRIRTTDQGGLSTEKAFTIVVTDDVAPTFQNSTPSVSNVNTAGATLTARLNEIGTAFFVVVADGATAPSSAQVVAGLNNSGAAALASGSVAVVSAGADFTTAIAGLSAGTAYDIYVVAQDDEITPNAQATPTLVNLTTSTQNALYFDDNAKVTGLTGISPAAFTVEFRLFLDSQTPPGNWQGIYWTNNNNDTGVFIEDNYAVSLWTTQSTAYKSDLLLTYGAWNHVAISYSAGNGVRMYINGVLSSTTPTGSPGAGVLPLTDVTIGYGPGNFGLPAGGYALGDSALEDFRIWNVERTQQEINDNKDAELAPPYSANLVRYYDFNHGIGGANNAGFTTLIERTGNGANGTLANFALNGDVSNWVETSSLAPVPVNQAPVITNLNANSVAWPGVGNTVTLDAGGDATVADAELDATSWDGASLTVQRNVGGTNTPVSSDLFSFNSSGYTLSGGNLQTGATTFGTFTNINGVLTISFNANATNSLVRDVMRGIQYRNDTPVGDATIRFALSDGTTSTTADVTVTTDYVYVTNATDTAVIDLTNGVSFSEAVAIAAADATGSQTLVLSSALTDTTMSLAGNLAINESLTINGDAANGLIISGSTITFANGTTLGLTNTSGTLTIGSTLAGSGSLSKSGGGTLALTSITNNSGWSGALSVLGGSLSVSGSTTPTFLPTGTLTLNGGTLSMTVVGTLGTTLTVPNSLILGASGGTISVGDNDALNAANFSGVISGAGSLTKSGMAILRLSGTNEYAGSTNVSAGTLRIASDSNLGSGNVTLASGVTLDVTVGGVIDNSIVLAGDATVNHSGNLTLSGVVSGANTLIKSGAGTLTLSGTNTYSATTVNAGTLSVGGDANLGSGVITLNNGTLAITSADTIDNAITLANDGTLNLAAATSFTGQLSGEYRLAKYGVGDMIVANSNNTNMTGEIAVFEANLLVADGSYMPSTVVLRGGNLIFTDATTVSSVVAVQADAFISNNNNVTLNNVIELGDSNHTLTKAGAGRLTLASTANSQFMAGKLVVEEGVLSVSDDRHLNAGDTAINGGTLAITATGIYDNNIVIASNAVIDVSNSVTATLSGGITGGGGLGKTGAGSLRLAGAGSFTGATNVSGGTLVVNDVLSGTSLVTVASGATIMGSGSVPNLLVNGGGTFSPGTSPGTFTVNGNLQMNSGSTLAVEINGTAAGTQYNQIIVNSAVDVSGATLLATHNYTAGQGDSYTIIVNDAADAITGTFSDLAEGATTTAGGNGTVLTASYIGGNGNDFTLAAPLNTAPVIANLNGDSVSFIEDSDLILLDTNSNATVTDGDSVDFDGGNVTVSIVSNRVSTEDVLSIRNEGTAGGQIGTSGLNITYGGTLIGTRTADGGTDINDLVITLNSAATPAIVQALVRNLTYTNTNTTTPDTGVRTVRVTVNDGDGGTSTSSNADIAVAVVATNDAPTLTTTGATPTFTEGGAAVGLFSGTSVSTVEPGQLITMLTVTVTNVSDGSDEILYFDGSDIPLINGFTGTSLIHGVDISVAVTGSTATLMLVKTTDLSAAQTLVDGMTYRNNSLTPTVANRVITITALQDDGGVADGGVDTSSPNVSATVTIAAVNSVPVVTTSADVTAFTEGNNVASTPVVIDSGITVSDLDNATLASATVSLTANFQAAEDMLAFTNDGSSMGNISASYDSNTGVLTLTSSGATATLAEWEIALAAVTYTNNSETPSESVREISFVVNDGVDASVASTKSVSVTAVNDTPTISVAGAPLSVNQGDLYDFTPSSSDIDGDTLIYDGVNIPSWISVDPNTGRIYGTPGPMDVGVIPFEFFVRVSDDNGANWHLSSGFFITVVNVNDAPVISGTPATSVNQGELYSFTPVASDVDADDTLTFTATGLPSWLSINPVTGAIFGTPGNADVGETGSIVITVTDDAGEAASLPAFTITVANVNDAPVISGTPATTVSQGELYSFTPVASDIDAGDTLTFTATGLPNWLSINPATGAIFGTPGNADVGETGSIVITVTDDAGAEASLPAFTITVVNVNDAPVISGTPTTSVNQGELYSFTPTASDVDAGDTLTFIATGLPNWLSINPATGAIFGTPGNADVGETGSIVITVTDDAGEAASLPAFTITVANVNDAPVISGTPATSVNQGELYSFTPVASDVDAGDTLTFTATGLPNWLSINPATGVITGTPSSADVGETGSIVITVTDDAGEAASLPAFTITVANVNDAPTVTSTPITTATQGELYSYTLIAADEDAGDVLTLSAPTLPSWLNFNPATGVLSGTPTNANVGSHAVVLRATDAAGLYIEQSFTIAVANVNDAPTVTSTPITTATQGELYSYTLIAADEDAGDSTTLSTVTLPDWLDFNPATGVLSGTPTNADVGSHAVVLRATDAAGLYIEQSFTIVVADVNDAPEISGTPATTVNQGELYSFTPVASDVDADDTLIFTATGLPSWLSINPVTGVISGTPGSADVGETGSIVITVTDDAGEAASLPAFTITVANVNDAPIISGTPATTVNQDELYSFTPTASDVDEEDTLTFSITNKPDWAVFDETTGVLSGTPAHAHVGITVGIVISVSDGTLTASLPAFNLEVIETIDPLLPVVTAPADITINATGLYTPVSLRQLLSLNPSVTQEQVEAILNSLASDGVSGNSCCTTRPEGLNDNDLLLLSPGRHEVVWSATNAAGMSGTATQVVSVNPLVSLSKSQIAIRGSAVEFRVLLNGKAPDYPFDVPYVLDVATTAASTEHNLVSGVARFTATGQLAVSVPVSITSLSGLTDSELVISLDDSINTGAVNTHTISIREGNIAPTVTLQLIQAGVNTTQITPSGGLVTVAATVIDLNSGDTHSYDWSASDRLLGDIDGDPVNHTFVFDPSGLTGRHQVQLAVTDSGGASTSAQLYFRIVDSLPVLLPDADTDGDGIDDETEGFGDSNGNGIPNYLDNMPSSNVLPQQGAVTHAFLLECDPGLHCGLGQFTLDSRSGGAQIFDEELASIAGLTVDQTFKPVGGIFDFVINDLPIPGQSGRVVIPQQAPIPAEAVYRKYQNGTWVSFVEDANNAIHSAPGNVGYCPPPGSPQWTLGLTEGHLCVQLTIEDGGPNDDDGLVNSAIADPGVVSVALPVEPPTPQPPTPEPPKPDIKLTSKGGGAVDGFWILLLGGLLMMQWLRTTRCKGLIALVLLGTSVSSQALTYDQAFVRVDVYKVEGGMRNAEFNQTLNAGYNFTLDNYRADRRGYQIAIGYQWHDYLYTELGYLDLGDVNVGMTLNGETDLPAFEQDLDNIYPRSGKGVTLVQGLTLFSEQPLNVSLEAGAYLWRDDRRTNQTDIKLDDAEGVAPLAGIRLNVELTKTLSLGVNTRRIYLDNETVDLYSLSGRYRF